MTRISQDVLFFLLNAAWQVAFVVLLASLGDRILRQASARVRHMLWVAALVASVALPMGSLLRVSAARTLVPVSPSGLNQDKPPAPADGKHAMEPISPSTHASPITSLPFFVDTPTVAFYWPLALAIASLYAFLLLYRAQVLYRAWMRTRALVRSAHEIELSERATEALDRCRRSLQLKHVTVLSSENISIPVTAGAIRPVLILPRHLLDDGDAPLLISALGHEAAHILRRDYLLNLAYELATMALWFHPGMRFVMRRIRQTRELRCDEIVAERLLEPCVFAQSLVQLAGAALAARRPVATIAVSMADADILEERIMRILRYSPARLRRGNMLSPIAAMLLAIPSVAAGAFGVHVAIRQPVRAVAKDQLGPATTPPQQSSSGQLPPRTSATTTADGKHVKTPVSVPDGPHLTETVVVVAQRVDNQAKDPAAAPKPDGQSGFHKDQAPKPSSGVAAGVAGGVTEGVGEGVGTGVGQGVGNALPRSQAGTPPRILSNVIEGNLIRLIEPVYPEEARTAGIEGDVVFGAIIGRTGDVEKLRVVSGHPILWAAAAEAIKQWKYEPYRLNGEPVEMEATLVFKFRLAVSAKDSPR
jgi:TonB family protein